MKHHYTPFKLKTYSYTLLTGTENTTILENKQCLIKVNTLLTYDPTILNAKDHLGYFSSETKIFFHTETCT